MSKRKAIRQSTISKSAMAIVIGTVLYAPAAWSCGSMPMVATPSAPATVRDTGVQMPSGMQGPAIVVPTDVVPGERLVAPGACGNNGEQLSGDELVPDSSLLCDDGTSDKQNALQLAKRDEADWLEKYKEAKKEMELIESARQDMFKWCLGHSAPILRIWYARIAAEAELKTQVKENLMKEVGDLQSELDKLSGQTELTESDQARQDQLSKDISEKESQLDKAREAEDQAKDRQDDARNKILGPDGRAEEFKMQAAQGTCQNVMNQANTHIKEAREKVAALGTSSAK